MLQQGTSKSIHDPFSSCFPLIGIKKVLKEKPSDNAVSGLIAWSGHVADGHCTASENNQILQRIFVIFLMNALVSLFWLENRAS